jgi:hypothetical protein
MHGLIPLRAHELFLLWQLLLFAALFVTAVKQSTAIFSRVRLHYKPSGLCVRNVMMRR